MYFVKLNDGTIHSAWDTIEKAKNQIRVLASNGYWNCSYQFIEGVEAQDGQYFV